jgi:hypothetical protein
MAWAFIIVDARFEISFDHLDRGGRHVMPGPTVLGQHRLALDEGLDAVVAEDGMDNLVVLGGGASPMRVSARFMRCDKPLGPLIMMRRFTGAQRDPFKMNQARLAVGISL